MDTGETNKNLMTSNRMNRLLKSAHVNKKKEMVSYLLNGPIKNYPIKFNYNIVQFYGIGKTREKNIINAN